MAAIVYRVGGQNNRRLGLLRNVRLMADRVAPFLAALVTGLLVAGCAAPPVIDLSTLPAGAPADFPSARYEQAQARGQSVYALVPDGSLLRVFAYRAGAMSRMGHDHVIASRAVNGFALITPNEDAKGAVVQVDLYLPFVSMTVDEEALRAEAGFNTELSGRAKAGTRLNMLADVEAMQYPHANVHIEASLGNAEFVATEIPMQAKITLHGQTKIVPVLAVVSVDAGRIMAEGHFSLRQSDFAIKPHSALNGALSVRNELDIFFRINAVACGPANVC